MSGKICVVGSSNTDMIVRAERIPKPGETILGGVFSTAAGGKGANQAVAAARAGGEVTFIARVGGDLFGDSALEGFKADGIDIGHVTRDSEAMSGVALIVVDSHGENSITVAPGANARLSPDDVYKARDVITSSDILLMQLEVPIETVEAAASIAVESGVRIILNPAPARSLSDALLAKVSLLTPNETEAELLTGMLAADMSSALTVTETLRGKGVGTVIVTMGSAGVFVNDGAVHGPVVGFKVEPVDTTAAGDVFNGALAVALAEGKTLDEACRFANGAAALSVTKLGAQPSAPKRADILRFLEGK